jgi:dipeptidyl aminopeptidase/acylaminoacyl peptidase
VTVSGVQRTGGRQVVPYGTWPSPISAEMLTDGVVALVDVWVDGDTTAWLEARPSEEGRLQVVALTPDGERRDVLPTGYSARSGVHEYGGGAAWVERGTVWFVNWSDQRLYRLPLTGGAPVALTPEPTTPRALRYADMRVSPDGRWLVCVRERHPADDAHDDPQLVVNEVVVLDADRPSTPRVVHASSDFVMAPRFVDAGTIRFVAWDHPNMPWNDTALLECSFDPATGGTGEATPLARGASYMQPVADVVISDRSGWWNLWRVGSGGEHPITELAAEVGGPAWVFGDRDHARLGDGRLVWTVGGTVYVDGVATATGAAAIQQLAVDGTSVTAIARSDRRHAEIVRFDAEDPAALETLVVSNELPIDPGHVSVPREIEFPTAGGATAHGWFYPPHHADVVGPDDEAPPLIVRIHGGPTSEAVPWFALDRQFWTTRGFAIVDVNYRGSTGFGTEYRNLLDARWGVVDVEDCLAAAGWLAAEGMVDPARLVIRGGSAGGFTVLAALTSGDTFAAGASLYGVADLTALATDTHKFESRYLDRLIGPWPAARAVYEERSPINHLDRFERPLIVFQGLDDRVVPPDQSEMIVAALQAKGVECEYHAYEGEGHGFRRASTIVHQLTHELAFYRRVLGLG